MTKQPNALAVALQRISTNDLKKLLGTMNEQAAADWTQDHVMVETHIIGELLNRGEDEWVIQYEENV